MRFTCADLLTAMLKCVNTAHVAGSRSAKVMLAEMRSKNIVSSFLYLG